ncbi:thiolase family protein [Rhodothermus marinus]|uniref:thiolase family protein n=2 Tax=Rhodothermus marinus TaxID=29549 RepID=UPI0012BA463F|nr:thiolase family protein [Rhodothermus marinus]BBM69846.1 acetyl-CoA acetyltransferase [Rhodothermus marinus]BBM72832.1 acetyl-CoA acetyltransferase [Rhodothermus marinus]
MQDVYIVTAVRTPIGKFGGALKDYSPVDLAAHAMKAALERAGVEGKDLDGYIFGNVLRGGHGQLIPRQAALKAGIPKEVDGLAVDMVCSSGMISVMTAATMIRAGEADLLLAGGVESMSQAGFYLSARARWGYKFLLGAPEQLVDLLLYDGLTDPMSGEAMGEQTERLAAEHGITREELDEIALMSHRRAAEATERCYFADEIVPITYRERRETKTLDRDEGIRPDTTREALAALKPAFRKDGVLTAGNSSQISDGAAALLLASRAAVERYGLRPIARLLGGAWAAGEPWRFPEAPVPAVRRLLDRLDRRIEDFDLFENNEAFAINSILFHRMLGVPYEKLNVHGGAIALGHPIGCSGARIIVTLVHALRRHNGTLGLAAICHGTGGGTAVAVERLA